MSETKKHSFLAKDHEDDIYDPMAGDKNRKVKNEKSQEIIFDNEIRYRCEQVNTTKIDGKPLGNAIQKFQFCVRFNYTEKIARVRLEDHYYNMYPPVLNKVFEFITQTEFIRNNVLFEYGNNGRVEKVLNKEEQRELWEKLKKSEKFQTEFVKHLENTSQRKFNEMIDAGNKQFSTQHPSEFEYQSTLFYLILFDKYLTRDSFDNPITEEKTLASNIFPGTKIPLQIITSKIKGDDKYILLRKVSEIKEKEDLDKTARELYDKHYKSNLHYNYTEYKIDYRLRSEIESKTKLINNARLLVREMVRDNIEVICEYKIRKLPNE